MLDLKHWGVRLKSVWLSTFLLQACQDAVLDNLWVWHGCVGGSLWTLGVSILCCLCLQCQIFLLSLPSVGMRQSLFWHSNHLELQVYPSWESLLWCYQAACRTVRPPRLHGLRLVHRSEWLRLVHRPEWLNQNSYLPAKTEMKICNDSTLLLCMTAMAIITEIWWWKHNKDCTDKKNHISSLFNRSNFVFCLHQP